MSYLKINGEDTRYIENLENFETQHGIKGIRFVGDEIPATDKGFKYYDDNDTEMFDLSDYKYEYRQNEYTVESDEIELPIGTDEPLPISIIEQLNNKINRVANDVISITPYTDTKIGYYGEKEKIFYGVPQGNLSVFFDNYNGDYSINRINDRVVIAFNTLNATTKISIMVQ